MIKTFVYITIFANILAATANANDLDSALFAPTEKQAPKIQIADKDIDIPLVMPADTPKYEEAKEEFSIKKIEDAEEKLDTSESLTDIIKAENNLQEDVSQDVSQFEDNSDFVEELEQSEDYLDYVAEDTEETLEEDKGVLQGTWVEKLANKSLVPPASDIDDLDFGRSQRSKKSSSSMDSLESMLDSSKNSIKLSNASVFDISGAMLRMSNKQIAQALTKRGFKLTSQKFEIPNFIKWRFEEQCRSHGVVGFERLNACVVKAAKENNHHYIASEKYTKYDTQEEASIAYTSNFTKNKVYKITYQSNLPRYIKGSSQKSHYLRDIKIFEFWRRINQKYGVPDNKEEVIWGLGGNKPYLKASTGFLLLEDPMLRELDYTRMSREDQKFLNTDRYNF